MSGAALARLLPGGLAIAVLPALFDADLATTRVQAQTRERVVYASAFDDNLQPVHKLGPEAFIVREDGAQREVGLAWVSGRPLLPSAEAFRRFVLAG